MGNIFKSKRSLCLAKAYREDVVFSDCSVVVCGVNSYISKCKQKKDSDSSRLTETRIDLADVSLDETQTSDADVDEMAEVKHRRRPGGTLENLRLADGVAEHVPAPTKQLQEGVERFLQRSRTITERSLKHHSQLSTFTY